MATKLEIGKLIVALSAAYPKYEPKPDTPEAYYMFLKDLPYEDLVHAAEVCIQSKDFFPSVHELRHAVAENAKAKSGAPNQYEAWEEVLQMPKDKRRLVSEPYLDGGVWQLEYAELNWSHPLVEKVALQMGWPSFPDEETMMADRAHFLKAYEFALYEAMDDVSMLQSVREYIKGDKPAQLSDIAKGMLKDAKDN